MDFFVYLLECSDGSYYVGLTTDPRKRLLQHRQGHVPSAYTFRRRPVTLSWIQRMGSEDDARALERQIKGWSRAKKEALIAGNLEQIHEIVRRERRRRERRKRKDETKAP